ncbi:MAG: hypothetical protein CL609_22790 [Anaerolineaceae bacterium]|nr:hypothetical protein [Anaerolineaceae bacterium]
MARLKRKNKVIVPLKLWLIPGRDDDLIEFFALVPPGKKAWAVMRSLRTGIRSEIVHEKDEIDNFETKLDSLGEYWVF